MSETLVQNETFTNLLNDLQIPDYTPSANVRALLAAEARYIKDLKINTGNVLNNNQHLDAKEAALLALAVAVNEKSGLLKEAFTRRAQQAGAGEAVIAEIIACASLMNTNNIFYRFRHFMQKDYYNNQPAGIKMSIMMNPVTGKEFFELVSLALSAVNGCEMCVRSHEESVLKHGSSEARVFEAVKLAAVIKGLITVLS
ncbi:MAG TPA: carboxymuconolactone decarboxylase family protein [Chitinophagaceae bacterium]|jgi:alkyl hydroperoxide reductase subunit D